MRHSIYKQFNLPADPFAGHIPTGDFNRIAVAVAAAVTTGAMIAIAGERGTGKTHALWHSLSSHDCSIVEPLRLDRERLHIGDIQSAIVMQLSDEKPRHSAEARAGQTRRILRAASRPVLVIDEAHTLHRNTLCAIKRLRELGARITGGGLLPVIFVGQYDPTERVAEVGLRTDSVNLTGLTHSEAVQIIGCAIGNIADGDTIARIAENPAARNHLELRRLVDDALAEAAARNEKRITVKSATVAQPSQPEAPAPGSVAATLNQRGPREAVA